jgi:alpha-1,3/alpha-1,6-mannosyltransferase
VFVDQLSISIPLLKLFMHNKVSHHFLQLMTLLLHFGHKVLFYCHFPDQLLTKRQGLLKRLYRLPVDFLEEITTGA